MDRVTTDTCAMFGGRVSTQSIKLSENVRKPLPYEVRGSAALRGAQDALGLCGVFLMSVIVEVALTSVPTRDTSIGRPPLISAERAALASPVPGGGPAARWAPVSAAPSSGDHFTRQQWSHVL